MRPRENLGRWDGARLEVMSIYAVLKMIATKCIHADRSRAAAVGDNTQELTPDHWQALIALYRTLLHEQEGSSLASRNPSASSALGKLARKHTVMDQRDRDAKTDLEVLELLLKRITSLEKAQRTLAASAGGQHEIRIHKCRENGQVYQRNIR